MPPEPFEWRHPELREGEVLLGNFEKHNFKRIPWKSKRRGLVARDGSGIIIDDHYDLGSFPVFVQRKELDDAGLKCDGQYTVVLSH